MPNPCIIPIKPCVSIQVGDDYVVTFTKIAPMGNLTTSTDLSYNATLAYTGIGTSGRLFWCLQREAGANCLLPNGGFDFSTTSPIVPNASGHSIAGDVTPAILEAYATAGTKVVTINLYNGDAFTYGGKAQLFKSASFVLEVRLE